MKMTVAEAKQLLSSLSDNDKLNVEMNGATIVLTKQTKQEILEEKYPNLIGRPITLSDAAEKYDVPRSTMQNWVWTTNYISPIDPDAYPKVFDEAEIAYISEIYHHRKKSGSVRGAPLLDDNGLAYELKRPDVAEYRRKKS